MLFNSYDEGRPYFDNKEVLEEYQMLLDYIFDYALDEEIGTDDFDLAAEALPDPSLDDAHEQKRIRQAPQKGNDSGLAEGRGRQLCP